MLRQVRQLIDVSIVCALVKDRCLLERPIHMAKNVPANQHHTGVARPPEVKGTAIVAGTGSVRSVKVVLEQITT